MAEGSSKGTAAAADAASRFAQPDADGIPATGEDNWLRHNAAAVSTEARAA